MTAPQAQPDAQPDGQPDAEPEAQPAVTVVQPDPDSRLAQLAAHYDLAKAEADKAAEALKAITDGIKHEAQQAAPGARAIVIDSPDLTQPLSLTHSRPWEVNTKRMKTEDPVTYVRWAERGSRWTLRRGSR